MTVIEFRQGHAILLETGPKCLWQMSKSRLTRSSRFPQCRCELVAAGTPISAKGISMIPVVKAKLLEGKRGLIVGIANDQSIAWGCAKAFRAFGAELAVTYLNDKAKKFVEPL